MSLLVRDMVPQGACSEMKLDPYINVTDGCPKWRVPFRNFIHCQHWERRQWEDGDSCM